MGGRDLDWSLLHDRRLVSRIEADTAFDRRDQLALDQSTELTCSPELAHTGPVGELSHAGAPFERGEDPPGRCRDRHTVVVRQLTNHANRGVQRVDGLQDVGPLGGAALGLGHGDLCVELLAGLEARLEVDGELEVAVSRPADPVEALDDLLTDEIRDGIRVAPLHRCIDQRSPRRAERLVGDQA